MSAAKVRYRVIADEYPDHSWLEQENVYGEDAYAADPVRLENGGELIPREDYVNPENHPSVVLLREEQCEHGGWHVVDSHGGIDFYTGPGSPNARDHWKIYGTFDTIEEIPDEYLRMLARDMETEE